jgi:anaerobic magnesium-protoporphyrin IX monomethyl ester cyclase
MKFIFCIPRFRGSGVSRFLPLGAISAATIVHNRGHAVTICDLNLSSQRSLERCCAGAGAVCFSAMIPHFSALKALCLRIRTLFPEMKIVIGGPITLSLADRLAADCAPDFISVGPAEMTMNPIIDIIAKSGPTGTADPHCVTTGATTVVRFEDKENKAIETAPFPEITLLDFRKYRNLESLFTFLPRGHCIALETTRGCPYTCIFCDKTVWGYRMGKRDAPSIAGYMKSAYDNLDINKFYFIDDLFLGPADRTRELCSLLKPMGDHIAWSCSARIDQASEELFNDLRSAGCRSVFMAIESGSQRILDTIRKRITIDMIRASVACAKRAGLLVTTNFIVGLPGENKETLLETRRLIEELPLDDISFSIATPFPNTPMFEWAKKNERLPVQYETEIEDWNGFVNVNCADGLSADEVVAEFKDLEWRYIFRRNYGAFFLLSPRFLGRAARKTVKLLVEGDFSRIKAAFASFTKRH